MRKIVEKQLVRDISALAEKFQGVRTPKNGWIRQIRELMFMSGKALAKRCGIDRTTLARLEQSEMKGSISLKSLERIADQLNCDVKYVLVPREPLDDTIMRAALSAAEKEISKVSHTMSLEDQSVSEAEKLQHIEDLAEQLVHKRSSSIWDDGE